MSDRDRTRTLRWPHLRGTGASHLHRVLALAVLLSACEINKDARVTVTNVVTITSAKTLNEDPADELHLVNEATQQTGKDLLDHVVAILVELAKKMDQER